MPNSVREIFIFELKDELEIVNGFFDVLSAILSSVTADVFDDVRLAVGETVLLAELNWLDRHILVVLPSYLRVEWVAHNQPSVGFAPCAVAEGAGVEDLPVSPAPSLERANPLRILAAFRNSCAAASASCEV
jgi:hypothetical protein